MKYVTVGVPRHGIESYGEVRGVSRRLLFYRQTSPRDLRADSVPYACMRL
jgi:hypothetical protein